MHQLPPFRIEWGQHREKDGDREMEEDILAGEARTLDDSLGYILAVIGSVLLSYKAPALQRDGVCLALAGDEIIARDGLPVKTVDTTAAGDSFTGGFITRLLEEGTDIASLSRETLTRILDFANTVGALTTTRKGAICALPTRDEVEAQLASNQ